MYLLRMGPDKYVNLWFLRLVSIITEFENLVGREKMLGTMHVIGAIIFICNQLIAVNIEDYSPDFHSSMGKGDPYMNAYYKKAMSKFRKPQDHFFQFLYGQCLPSEAWKFWANLYSQNKLSTIQPGITYRSQNKLSTIQPGITYRSQNKLSTIQPNSDYRIPRVFHQIWVGPRPMPAQYKIWAESWKNVPGWTYKLWTNKEAEEFIMINRELYFQEKNMGARSDILRLEILYREGGVYIDTDFECIKPEMFDLLNRCYDFYAGLLPLNYWFCVANGLIGSIPGHPVVKACIENMAKSEKLIDKWDSIANKGPGLLTRMIFLHGNRDSRDIVFPASFFYPLPSIWLQKIKKRTKKRTLDLEAVKKQVMKKESMAIHWWEKSWIGNGK